jgi:hypothetical protein
MTGMSTSPKKDLTANPKAPRRAEDRSPEDKLRLVVEAAKLSESELGAFLRREGVHDANRHPHGSTDRQGHGAG